MDTDDQLTDYRDHSLEHQTTLQEKSRETQKAPIPDFPIFSYQKTPASREGMGNERPRVLLQSHYAKYIPKKSVQSRIATAETNGRQLFSREVMTQHFEGQAISLPLKQRGNQNKRQLHQSNLFISSNFQMKLFCAWIANEDDFTWVVTQSAKRSIKTDHLPQQIRETTPIITREPTQEQSISVGQGVNTKTEEEVKEEQLLNQYEQSKSKPPDFNQYNWIDALPYAAILKPNADNKSETEPSRKQQKSDLTEEMIKDYQEIFDQGSEREHPLSALCSAKLLNLLRHLELSNIAIAASVVLLNSQVLYSTGAPQNEKEKEEQIMRHLDFFKEKAREFILDQVLKSHKGITAFNPMGPSKGPFQFHIPGKVLNIQMGSPIQQQRRQRIGTSMTTKRRNISTLDNPLIIETSGISEPPMSAMHLKQTLMKQQTTISPYSFGSTFTNRLQIQTPFSGSRFTSSNKQNLKQQIRLLSPSEYLNQALLSEESPQLKQSNTMVQSGQKYQPLLKLNQITPQIHPFAVDSKLIQSLQHQFKLSEQDFKQSLKLFHDSIKDFQKSHLIEMKNLRSHEQRPLIYQLMAYVIRMQHNIQSLSETLSCQATSLENLQMIIQEESLKQIMVKIDPINKLALPTALSILNEVELEEKKFQKITQDKSNTYLGVIHCLLKFIYNGCILTIGSKVFGYESIISTSNNQQIPQSPVSSKASVRLDLDFALSQGKLKMKEEALKTPVNQSKVSPQKRSKTSAGVFLKPKHLYFENETRSLQVSPYIPSSIPVFNLHETLPNFVLRDHFDEVELPDIDLYNYQDVSLAKYVPKTSPILRQFQGMHMHKMFPFLEIHDKLKNMPVTNEGIIHYTKDNKCDDMPTAVLIKLGDLMKHRRNELYEKNDVNINVNKHVFKLK